MSRKGVGESDGRDGLPEGFLELPARLHADDPDWIPEKTAAVEAAFSPRNPWFQWGRARSLCVRDEARLAVFRIPSHRIEGDDVAYFGFFETRPEGAALETLFERAATWAKAEGASTLYGPIDFHTYGRYRLRIDADARELPFTGEPYNPRFYPPLVERHGFERCQRYFSYAAPHGDLAGQLETKRDLGQKLLDEGFRMEPLTPGIWMDLLPRMHPIADAVFRDNFGYLPLSPEAFQAQCGEAFIRKYCPRSSVLVRDAAGEAAGFLLTMPHYGALVTQRAGPLRVDEADLDYGQHLPELERRGTPQLVLKTTGVHPSQRSKGLFDWMLFEAWRRAGEHYGLIWSALMREGNLSQRLMSRARQRIVREYALYRRSL